MFWEYFDMVVHLFGGLIPHRYADQCRLYRFIARLITHIQQIDTYLQICEIYDTLRICLFRLYRVFHEWLQCICGFLQSFCRFDGIQFHIRRAIVLGKLIAPFLYRCDIGQRKTDAFSG